MSGYRERVRTADGSETADVPPLPCRVCGNQTDVPTLMKFGARCLSCFNAYCREPRPGRHVPQSVLDGDGNRRWARILKHRHDQGEALSSIQVDAYRKALGEVA